MREGPEEHSASDGSIDFSGYSLAQLHDLRGMLDRISFPKNFANLIEEIERRRVAADSQPTAPDAAQEALQPESIGRFTRHDGWRGWLQALRRRATIFGAGVLEVTPEIVRLLGSRRSWLGVAGPGEYTAPIACIRNAAVYGAELRFEIKHGLWPTKTVTFEAASPEQAHAILARLPERQSTGFERRWRETREFNDRLNALGRRHWVTPALVLANGLVFAAMLVAARNYAPDMDRILDWGANFGPLTTSGQWWRLVASMFLHGSWAHLLLNMWVLWHVGRLTERLFGSAAFAFLYFATGICGSLTRTVWDPAIVSLGASGAIFGVVGALLAVLLHKRAGIPRSIAFAHWPSTLLFALFNLLGGLFDPLIDNAVHLGGFLSGGLFGWSLVRPIDSAARRAFPFRQVASATALAVLLGAAFFSHLRTAGGQASVTERYMLDRPWYSRGEIENLQLWNELTMRASTGTISEFELAETFDKEIVPFWKDASGRLEREAEGVPEAQRSFDKMLREFVRLRLAWAEAIVAGARSRDASKGAEITRLAAESQKVLAGLIRFSLRANLDQRPRALAHSGVVVRIRNYFSAGSGECIKPPAESGELPAFSDAVNDGPKVRAMAGCRAQHLFVTSDYQALEDLMSSSARTLADSPDGGSTLSGVLAGLDDYFEYGPKELEQVMGRTSDWRRSVNNPVGAELTEILLFRDWAWSARGHGYSNSVSRQNWEVFAMRLEMAAAGLRDIRASASVNPLWYQLALQVGADQQVGQQELDQLFAEAVERFPDYLPIYAARMRPIMPRWGGTLEELDGFIRSAADSGRGTLDADERYAQLYAAYAGMERDEINIFAAGNADWPRIQDGFDRLRRRYSRSDAILNLYAKMACTAGDAEKYHALRAAIGDRRSSLVWSGKRTLESCARLFEM